MEIRRKLALLLAVAVWTVALTIPALMLAPDSDDPLAPIGPLASLEAPLPADEALMQPLRHEASAALSELQAASTARNEYRRSLKSFPLSARVAGPTPR